MQVNFGKSEFIQAPIMPTPLKIQHLRQFLLAADHGSFRQAAQGTFRSQAAV